MISKLVPHHLQLCFYHSECMQRKYFLKKRLPACHPDPFEFAQDKGSGEGSVPRWTAQVSAKSSPSRHARTHIEDRPFPERPSFTLGAPIISQKSILMPDPKP